MTKVRTLQLVECRKHSPHTVTACSMKKFEYCLSRERRISKAHISELEDGERERSRTCQPGLATLRITFMSVHVRVGSGAEIDEHRALSAEWLAVDN